MNTLCIRLGLVVAVALELCVAALAQLPHGGWLVGGDMGYVTYWTPGFALSDRLSTLYGSGVSGGGAYAVDGRRVVFMTDGNSFYRVTYDPHLTPGARLVIHPPGIFHPMGSAGVVTTARGLLSLDAFGNLSSIDTAVVGTPTLLGSVWAGSVANGYVFSTCSDGRELFFAVGLADGIAGHVALANTQVWAVDLESPSFSRRLLATIPVDMFTTLAMGPDGDVLAMRYDGLFRISPVTGALSNLGPKPPGPDFVVTPGYAFGLIFMGYDPWTDTIAVGPRWLSNVLHLEARGLVAPTAWALAAYLPFFATLKKLASASEAPFLSFGRGCPTSLGAEPRLGHHGLPLQGATFDLTIRNAEPNGFGVFWVGQSDAVWPGLGLLPLDAAPLGAPGCILWASADYSIVALTDALGHAATTLTVPQAPTLHGLEVFAQAACTSGGNALGWAASDALAIRIR